MLGAAEELGMGDLQQMCERFIREEQEMANVFFEQLGSRHKTGRIARWAGPIRNVGAGWLVPVDLGLPSGRVGGGPVDFG